MKKIDVIACESWWKYLWIYYDNVKYCQICLWSGIACLTIVVGHLTHPYLIIWCIFNTMICLTLVSIMKKCLYSDYHNDEMGVYFSTYESGYFSIQSTQYFININI